MAQPHQRQTQRMPHALALPLGAPQFLWALGQRFLRDAAMRDRALAHVVFAGIFVFAVGSFDFLITGGPEWNPGPASAATQVQHLEPTQTRNWQAETAEPPPQYPGIEPRQMMIADGAPVEELLGGPEITFASLSADEGALALSEFELPLDRGDAKPQDIAYVASEPMLWRPTDKMKAPAHS
jgi:hypothetical protein